MKPVPEISQSESQYRVFLVAPAYYFGIDRADQMVSISNVMHKLEQTANAIAQEFCKNAPAVVSVQVQKLPSGEITSIFRGLLSDKEFAAHRDAVKSKDFNNWSDFTSSTAH